MPSLIKKLSEEEFGKFKNILKDGNYGVANEEGKVIIPTNYKEILISLW